MTRFQVAQDPGKTWPQQKSNPRQFRDLDGVDRGERAQDSPLLFGQTVIAQRGTEMPHHRFTRAQQRHRQRTGEFPHRHAPDAGLARRFRTGSSARFFLWQWFALQQRLFRLIGFTSHVNQISAPLFADPAYVGWTVHGPDKDDIRRAAERLHRRSKRRHDPGRRWSGWHGELLLRLMSQMKWQESAP